MDLIDRNNTITSICQWLTTLERKNEYILTVAKMKQNIADIICEEPTVDAVPLSVIDEIEAEIEQKEKSLNFALVSDVALKTAYIEVLKIIDEKVKEYTSCNT